MSTPPQVLKARVTLETRIKFRGIAAARGLTESDLLRQLINHELEGQHPEDALPSHGRLEQTRLTVRVAAFILDAVKAKASQAGMAPSRWIASLIQSNLVQAPVLTAPQLAAVEATLRELAAAGRNISQIARSLNESSVTVEAVSADALAAHSQKIDQSQAAMRQLVRASRSAWLVER
jgi:predicted DNA binding CopG/RHH family protein